MTPAAGMNKAELFKAKGAEILKPRNMKDFIIDPQIAQIHKTTNAQIHIPIEPNSDGSDQEKLGRLHVQIRQDLIDRLLDIVFKRKKASGMTKRTASQRAIIEEALEQYFENNEGKNGSNPPVDKTSM